MDQGQLWNAGPVRSFTRTQAQDRKRQSWRTATGADRERQRRRRAKKLGLSLHQFDELQAAVAICRALRRASMRPPLLRRSCEECGSGFETRLQSQVVCSDKCRRKRISRNTSASIQRRYRQDPEFREKVIANQNARRAEKLGLGSVKITISYLLERDKWTCGICHRKIRRREDASPDHIVPLSRGGEHVLENLQAAHKKCNYSKGNRGGGEQLRVIG